MKAVTSGQLRTARAVAILADVVQVGLFPLFFGGAFSPLNDALDVGVALVLFALLGWHWALLPSVVAEAVPGLDLFPTWTAAVFYATRAGATAAPPAPTIRAEAHLEGAGR